MKRHCTYRSSITASPNVGKVSLNVGEVSLNVGKVSLNVGKVSLNVGEVSLASPNTVEQLNDNGRHCGDRAIKE